MIGKMLRRFMERYVAGRVQPVEVSEKLDGVYARATKDGVFSKSGRPLDVPRVSKRLRRHFRKHPEGALEGELWNKKAGIEGIAGAARAGGDAVKGLRLHVYPGQGKRPLPIGAVRRVKGRAVKDDAGVQKAFRKALRKGREGVVVRDTAGGKSKLKPVEDAEYQVAGVKAGGKTVLTMRTAEGRPFKVQAGGGAAGAKAGDKVQVRYSGLTRGGKPKAAVAVRVRNENDFAMKNHDFRELTDAEREQIRKDRRALLKGAALTAAGGVAAYAILRKKKLKPIHWNTPRLPSPRPVMPSRREVVGMKIAKGRVIGSGRTIRVGEPKLSVAKEPKAAVVTTKSRLAKAAENTQRKGGMKRTVKAAELKRERAWDALRPPSSKRLAKLHPNVRGEYLRMDGKARTAGVKPPRKALGQLSPGELAAARSAGAAPPRKAGLQLTGTEIKAGLRGDRMARQKARQDLLAYREKKNFQTAFTMRYFKDQESGGRSQKERDAFSKARDVAVASAALTSAGVGIYGARQLTKTNRAVRNQVAQYTPQEIARAVGAEVSGKAKRTLKGYFPTFIKGGKKLSKVLKRNLHFADLTHEELMRRYNNDDLAAAKKKKLGISGINPVVEPVPRKRGFLFETPASRVIHFGNANQWRRENDQRYGDPWKAAAKLERGYYRYESDGRTPIIEGIPLHHAQVLKSTYNKAHKIQRKVGRGGALLKDVGAVATGRPRDKDAAGRTKKREWEKPWFKTAARNAVITGGLILGAKHVAKDPEKWRRRVNKGVRKVNSKVPDLMKEWEEGRGQGSGVRGRKEKSFAAPASRILGKFEKPLRKGVVGKFMGPSAESLKVVAQREALAARLKRMPGRRAAQVRRKLVRDTALKQDVIRNAHAAKKAAIRGVKKGAVIAGTGAVLGGSAMKLHADQPEKRKVEQGARFRNALVGAAAGGMLGSTLAGGKSGYGGARIGALAGGLIGAVSNPKRKRVIEELPLASFAEKEDGKEKKGSFIPLGAAAGYYGGKEVLRRVGKKVDKATMPRMKNADLPPVVASIAHRLNPDSLEPSNEIRKRLAKHVDPAFRQKYGERGVKAATKQAADARFKEVRRRKLAKLQGTAMGDPNPVVHGSGRIKAAGKPGLIVRGSDTGGGWPRRMRKAGVKVPLRKKLAARAILAAEKTKVKSGKYGGLGGALAATAAGAGLGYLADRKFLKKEKKDFSEKRFKKVVTNPETGRKRTVAYGQAGKAADGKDRIRPGTAKGDAYCARSANIKGDWKSDPNSPNNLSRQKWKCRGEKSMRGFATPASKYFDDAAEYAGWDVRDPRGRSARVFAPGSRKRVRRQKEWHERKENRDKLAAAAVAAAGIGGFALGRKTLKAGKVSAPALVPARMPMAPRSAPRTSRPRPAGRWN